MEDQAENLRQLMKERTVQSSSPKIDQVPPIRKTRIIAVTSGKGGVGKTNVSVNMGIAYAKMGKKVIVVDADLGLANVNVMMNIIPKFNLYHVLRKQKRMADIIMDTDYGIKLVAGASGLSKIANMEEAEREDFIKEMYSLAEADVVIIDTSAGVSKNVLGFVAAADEVVIVTTSEPTAITDAYGMIKIIATEVNNYDLNLKMIVNRVNSAMEGRKISERLISIANQFLNVKVDYLGFIYNDQAVEQAVLKQKPFLINAPKSKAASCIRHIVAKLEKTDYNELSGLTGFLQKLFGRKWE